MNKQKVSRSLPVKSTAAKDGSANSSANSVRSMNSPKVITSGQSRSSGNSRSSGQSEPTARIQSTGKPAMVKQVSSNDSFDDDAPIPEGLVRCSICKRNFAEDRIEKHQVICQKTKVKKRKVYDASKKRVQVSWWLMEVVRTNDIHFIHREPKPSPI